MAKNKNILYGALALLGLGGIALLMKSNPKFQPGDKLKAIGEVDVYKAAGQPRHGIQHTNDIIGTVKGYSSNGNWLIIQETGYWIPAVHFDRLKKF